jgi:hypothetical protein
MDGRWPNPRHAAPQPPRPLSASTPRPSTRVTRAAPEAARPAPLGAGPAEQAARRVSRLAGRRLP